jgi:ribosome biogenesis GTPase
VSLTGRVRKYHSNFYYVEAEGVLYECMLRGLIKKEGTEVLVGDEVRLDSVQPANKTARISEVLPRRNVISRPKMANADQVLVVYSLHSPEFDYQQANRYLTHIELAGLTPILCISKSDLANGQAERDAIFRLYAEALGYTVLFTSVHQPESLEQLRQMVRGKVTVLAGPSGSGKSSLLNALNPALQLRVGEVSEKIRRGQHTTRHVELLTPNPGDPDTLIADTPGFSNLKFNTVLPVHIARIYRDFSPWREQCAFSDCLHLDEEGCAVLDNRAQIAESRYETYCAIMEEARQYKAEADAASQKEEFGYKRIDRKGKELKILRLKDKDRDLSRRRLKQQFSQFSPQDEGWDAGPEEHLESDNFPL